MITVSAAVVAAVVSLIVSVLTTWMAWIIAERKIRADQSQAATDKAWADYELRRDVYLDFAQQVSTLFVGADPSGKPELHRVARKIRLVGSDRVVNALNAFTGAIIERKPSDMQEQRYRALFNAMRQDIRQIHVMPPEGTDLAEDAFPLEA